MAKEATSNLLTQLSTELARIVERVGASVVRVDDGTRLTATGFVWSADGVVVTTSHGVERDEDLAIELADGVRHTATLIGRDPDTDLAVLRVEAGGLTAVERAEIGDVKPGNLVLALGRPGNFSLQATIGIVSARHESQTHGQPGYILNTDAVLHPGFSGGPLVDMRGRVVGMANLMFGRGRGVALGTPIVAQVAQTLLTQGQVRRGYLGIRTQTVTLTESLIKSLGAEQENGLLVVQVESGSAADQSGLLVGDILLGIDGQAVQDGADLRHRLRAFQAGQTISLKIVRGGEWRDVTATLGAER